MSPAWRQRRVHPRAALEVAVTLESDHNFYAGVADDVSEGGVFVATIAPPAVGAIVDLTLVLPDSAEQFICTGVVRWLREVGRNADVSDGCGIQWIAISPEALEAIRRFVGTRDTLLFEVA